MLDALLARPASTEALLAALEAERIAPGEVDAAHRQRLLGTGNEPLRARAAKVFAALGIGPRQAVLGAFAAAKTRPAIPTEARSSSPASARPATSWRGRAMRSAPTWPP